MEIPQNLDVTFSLIKSYKINKSAKLYKEFTQKALVTHPHRTESRKSA